MLKAILFDFDETLVSVRQANYYAYKKVLETFDIYSIKDSEKLFHDIWYRNISSKDALNLLTRDPSLIEKIQQDLFFFYQQSHLHYISVYPGIVDTLQLLRNKGLLLFLASLKLRNIGEKELDFCGLRHFFDFILWGNDLSNPKPNPETCNMILHKFSLSNQNLLICGDGTDDINMGKAAHISTLAALWGDTNKDSLLLANPDFLCHSPNDILNIINLHFS